MAKYAPQIDGLFPIVISQDEYDRDWKPHGWKLIVIGPTSTWREEWGYWEAIRDIVQNCLDEAEAYSYGYDDRGLWIADKGKGVAVSDFLLGPPKLKPDWARDEKTLYANMKTVQEVSEKIIDLLERQKTMLIPMTASSEAPIKRIERVEMKYSAAEIREMACKHGITGDSKRDLCRKLIRRGVLK